MGDHFRSLSEPSHVDGESADSGTVDYFFSKIGMGMGKGCLSRVTD